jgi:uncharacterized protein
MRINVAQLLKEGVGGVRQHSIDGELHDLDAENPGPTAVRGRVQLMRTPRGILVTGQARMRMVQSCRRCLEAAEHDVVIDVEEEFIPSIDVVTGATLPITDDDESELVIDEHHILDLTEVLRQLAVAESTEMSLCRPDCKGLCPVCGTDLNCGPCRCAASRGDSRFAALATLLHPEGDDIEQITGKERDQ